MVSEMQSCFHFWEGILPLRGCVMTSRPPFSGLALCRLSHLIAKPTILRALHTKTSWPRKHFVAQFPVDLLVPLLFLLYHRLLIGVCNHHKGLLRHTIGLMIGFVRLTSVLPLTPNTFRKPHQHISFWKGSIMPPTVVQRSLYGLT